MPEKNKILLLILLGLVILVFGFYAVKCDVTHTGNETSRLAVVQSAADLGHFNIDGSIFATPDKARLNGKLYGDKPPLLTFISLGEYLLLKHCFGLSFREHYPAVMFLLNLFYYFCSIACGIVFYILLSRQLPQSAWSYRVFGSVMSVLSTLILSYSVTINNHTPAALFLLLFLLALSYARGKEKPFAVFLFSGICAGLVFNCEFVTGGVFGLCGAVLSLILPENRKIKIQCFCFYAAGALPMLLLEGLLNDISYGSMLPLYLLTHHPDMSGKNYFYYAFQILFGFEGLFLYTPSLLFLFYFLFRKKFPKDPLRNVMLSGCVCVILLFIIASSDYGGWCYGFRFFVPLAPVMLYYVFYAFGNWQKSFLFYLFCFSLIWGCVTSLVGTVNPWNASFEGQNTKKGTICEHVHNSFLANLLAWSFEKDEKSVLTRFLVEKVYTKEIAIPYLLTEYWCTQNEKMLQKLYLMNQQLKEEKKKQGPVQIKRPDGKP